MDAQDIYDFPDDPSTYGNKYGPAMEIQTAHEACWYLKKCVMHHLAEIGLLGWPGPTAEEKAAVEAIEKENIAYYAGYYDHETRLRVEKLFDCVHPSLGAASNGQLTPAEIIAAGYAGAKKLEEVSK